MFNSKKFGVTGGLKSHLLAFAFGCASLFVSHAIAQEKVLNIYHWSDYMASDTISNFEKETGIKVNIDYLDNNEILHAKLMAGSTGYDIVVPSIEWAKLQIQANLFQPIDQSKLSNLGNIDPVIQQKLQMADPGNTYLVDWMWGYTTMGINVKKVQAALGDLPIPNNEWDLLFDPKYMSKLKQCGVSFLDSSDVVFIAMKYLNIPSNTTKASDYKQVLDMLNQVRPYIKKFTSSAYIEDLANGELCVSMGWSGDIGIARQRAIEAKNGHVIQTIVPKYGAYLMFDTMAIPKDAKHVENAHLFINYILRPEVAASLTNAVLYANPNKASLPFVDPAIADDKTVFLSTEDLQKMYLPAAITNEMRRMSTRTFNQFKTGR